MYQYYAWEYTFLSRSHLGPRLFIFSIYVFSILKISVLYMFWTNHHTKLFWVRLSLIQWQQKQSKCHFVWSNHHLAWLHYCLIQDHSGASQKRTESFNLIKKILRSDKDRILSWFSKFIPFLIFVKAKTTWQRRLFTWQISKVGYVATHVAYWWAGALT